MMYNIRNRSNDTTKSQKEKKEYSFSVQPVKNHMTKKAHSSQYCV